MHSTPHRRARIRGPVTAFGLLGSLGLLTAPFTGGCSGNSRGEAQSAEEPPALRVRSARVEDATLAEPIHATGFVLDESERTLSFAVEGVVARVNVDEGDTFRRGQVLATLELTTVAARVDQANAALERAERELARAETLASTATVARRTLEDATTAAELSRADLRLARFARQHAVIVAEGDGVVLARAVDARETVGAGTPVLVVSLAREGRVVRVALTDREIVRVAVGDRVSLAIDAHPGRPIEGRVRRAAVAPDRSNGLFPVEIEAEGLSDPAIRLVAGLVARATIHPADARPVRLVPARALVEADEDHAFVWALAADGRTATRRDVRLAFLDGERVALASGLDGVGSVVTDGAPYVRTGLRLAVATDPASTTASNEAAR